MQKPSKYYFFKICTRTKADTNIYVFKKFIAKIENIKPNSF